MSIFHPVTAPCPRCAASLEVRVCASVNADRSPGYRDQILDGTFQQETCPRCGTSFQVEPSFSYVDAGRSQWMLVRPVEDAERWWELDAHATRLFATAYGERAGPAARKIGAALRARVAFGWAAAREKVLCGAHGIDDVDLELVKLLLIRTGRSLALGDRSELRLIAVRDDTLVLAWLADGAAGTAVEAPRALLRTCAGEEWSEARREVAAGPYVDVDRILTPIVS